MKKRFTRRPWVAMLAAAIAMAGLGVVPSLVDSAKAEPLGAGSPDPTFGPDGDGIVSHNILGGIPGHVEGVAFDSQRRTYVLVRDGLDDEFLFIARLTTDGALDHTYGLNGVAGVQIAGGGSNSFVPTDLAVDSQDRAVATGWYRDFTNAQNNSVTVARFTTHGALDSSFDGDGRYSFTFVTNDPEASHPRALALTNDNSIVVVGNNGPTGFIQRFTPDGPIDLSFGGGDGYQLFTQHPGWDSDHSNTQYHDVTLTSTTLNGDQIVVTGYALDSGAGTSHPLIHRYFADGAELGFTGEPDSVFEDLTNAYGVGVAAFPDDGIVIGAVRVGDPNFNWAMKVGFDGNPDSGWFGSGIRDFSLALRVKGVHARGDDLYISGANNDATTRIRAINPSDGQDTTGWGESGFGEATFPLGGTNLHTETAIDSIGRVVTAWADNTGSMAFSAGRLTTPSGPPQLSATKIFFNEESSIYAMSSDGSNVVTLTAPPFGNVTYTRPVANFAGDVFFQRNDNLNNATSIQRVGQAPNPSAPITVSDGISGLMRTPSGGFENINLGAPGNNESEPSTSCDFHNCFVGFVSNRGGILSGFQYAIDGGFWNTTYSDGIVGITDFDLHPTDPDAWVAVQYGNVILGRIGTTQTTTLVGDGTAEKVEWGLDGQIVAWMYNDGDSRRVMQKSADGGSVFQVYDDEGAPGDLNFASSPDLADPNMLITVGGGTDAQMFKVPLYPGGGELQTIRTNGDLLGVSDWNRNFAAYPFGDASLAPTAVPAANVPIQGGAPANQDQGQILSAGLVQLSLLKSGLLQLSLLKSGLLQLSLLKSGLLQLSLLKSGLLQLSLLKSNELPPQVEKGLDAISLAMMPITGPADTGDARGWRERIAALPGPENTANPEAIALSKLALTEISLGDIVRLPNAENFAWPAISQLDLTNSAFGSLNAMVFLLADTQLRDITASRQGGWCAALEELPGNNDCEDFGGLDATLFELQIAGVNLDDLDLDGNAQNGPDLATLKVRDFDLDSDTSPLLDIKLNSIVEESGAPRLGKTTLGGILESTLPQGPQGVVATPCSATPEVCATKTLADVQSEGRLRSTPTDATVGDLGAAAGHLPMYEVILGLIGNPVDDPFDKPNDELGIVAELGGDAPRFGVSFSRSGMGWGVTPDPRINVTLPQGFRYQKGSAKLDPGTGTPVPIPDPIDASEYLEFDLNVDVGNLDVINLSFGAYAINPPTGDDAPQLSATISDGAFLQAVGSDPVTVTDPLEYGDSVPDCDSEQTIDPDTLYFTNLEPRAEGESPDVDYFCIPAPEPGSTLKVYLNQLKYEADLAVFHPINLDGSSPSDALRGGALAAPATQVLDDVGAAVYNAGEPLISDGEADLPLPPGAPVAGISNKAGTKAERVEAITWPADGGDFGADYLVQVSGLNGPGGEERYALRYTVTPPKDAPVGPARTQFSGDASTGPGDLPDQLDTLVLHAPTRLTDLHGGVPAGFDDALSAYAAATNGVILNVDSDPEVLAAFAAADAAPGLPDLHNAVVRAINDAVDEYLGERRGELDNIVIVGGDDVIPFARLMDLTATANEQTFVEELVDASSTDAAALIGSALAGRFLSDDPYGSFTPRAFGGTWLYVPDVALGRLVETPDHIKQVLDEFLPDAPGGEVGVLRPNETLSVGADFMKRMANSINGLFDEQLTEVPASEHETLISDLWSRTDLSAALVEGGTTADVIALNAHYTPTFLIPPSRTDATNPADPDLPAGVMTGDADFRRRLFLTMGCHSGFSISNFLTGAAGQPSDFPEALSADAVAAFIGNTGYGIGLEHVDAFSQTLFTDVARFLGHGSVGRALTTAKQAYLANNITNPYDYKVVQQAVFYGLPQYRIEGATPLPPAPPGPEPFIDDISQLRTASVARSMPIGSNDKWDRTSTDDGDFWSYDNGGHAIAQFRPVQPTIKQEVTQPGLVARGVMVTGARLGDSESGFDPVLARPVIADPAREDEIQFGEVVYPAKLAEVANYGEDGAKQRLQLVPAQFRSSGLNSDGKLVGVERRFSELSTQVFYVDAGDEFDTTTPVLSDPVATFAGGVTEFSVRVDDDNSEVRRVTMLYRRTSGSDTRAFRLVELTPDPENPGRWFAGLQLAQDEPVEFLFQAVNSNALVGSISNHGSLFDEVGVEEAPEPGVVPDVVSVSTDKDPENGFYDDDVEITFSSEQGLPITVTELGGDAEESVAGDDVVVTAQGDGAHTYLFQSTSDEPDVVGDSGVFTVTIDARVPTVEITSPADGDVYDQGSDLFADFACADAHLVSCVAEDSNGETVADGDALDTAEEGTRTLTVRATDAAGRETEVQHEFTIEGSVDTVTVTANGEALEAEYGAAVNVVIASDKANSQLTVSVQKGNGTPVQSTHTGTATIPLTEHGDYTISYSTSRGAVGSVAVGVDLTPPTVEITSPSDGHVYVLGDTAPAVFDCTDEVTCDATPLDRSTFTTGTPRNFTVTATDAYGRSAQKTHTYFVAAYADGTPCAGGYSRRFTQPVDGKVRVLPTVGYVVVRFPLCDAQGVIPADRVGRIGPPVNLATGAAAPGACDKLLGLLPRICLPLLNPPDTAFSLDSTKHWRFIQDTSALALGKHNFRVRLPDGSSMDYSVTVTHNP